MKKIITVLFAVLAMSSMFAYIPNKKNVEKYGDCIVYGYKHKDIYGEKKTSYILYNTKTGEIYFQHYESFESMKKKYSPDLLASFIENKERMWRAADGAKKSYRSFTSAAEFCKEYYKEEPCCDDKVKENISIAKEIEKQFLDDYPFFTEENWQTLTKEEWNKMAKDFLENN